MPDGSPESNAQRHGSSDARGGQVPTFRASNARRFGPILLVIIIAIFASSIALSELSEGLTQQSKDASIAFLSIFPVVVLTVIYRYGFGGVVKIGNGMISIRRYRTITLNVRDVQSVAMVTTYKSRDVPVIMLSSGRRIPLFDFTAMPSRISDGGFAASNALMSALREAIHETPPES
jgi:hypothetical protein